METELFKNKTMSSLEIAKLTSKQHAHVMRDIRNLLSQGVAESNFGLAEYSDNQGKPRPCFNLTKKGCLILASGYDAVLREKIIDRWESLETGKAEPMAKQSLTPSELILQLAQFNVENERKMKALESKQEQMQAEIEEIKQRTTTDLHQSTIVAYISRNSIKLDVSRYGAMGRKASALCKKRGVEPTKIHDVRWGTVKVYPDEILDVVFGMGISNIN